MPPQKTLSQKLQSRIKAEGSLRLDHYIECALWDEAHGYYRQEMVFGAKGDFITAPEISQIFGEVIGVWALGAWMELGEPASFVLLEMGAGRGVLMRDILRTTRLKPAFMQAMDLHILEKSEARREEQIKTIGRDITFLDQFALPPKPAIILSNEFFDALPIRQFRNEGGGWLEAFINEGLEKIWQPCAHPPAELAPHRDKIGIVEINIPAIKIAQILGAHIQAYGGHMLTIDYGEWDGAGDSFQAVQNHEMVDPFTAPGEADLTAHLRFLDMAHAAGLDCQFMTQGAFLESYGGAKRRDALEKSNPELVDDIRAAYDRLMASDKMGELFKVLLQKAPQPVA